MQKFISDSTARLDVFLSSLDALNLSRNLAQKLITKDKVLVNSRPVTKISYKIKPGDIVEIQDFNLEDDLNPKPKNIKLDILYEDNFLLVINKQKGLLTHPTSYDTEDTLVNALLYHCDKLSNIGAPSRPGIVHRLDKDTSGLMLAAKTDEAHESLSLQIQNKTAVRKYLSFVYGIVDKNEGIINKPLVHYMDKTVKMKISTNDSVGKDAITHYKVLKRYNDATLIELSLKTGRTHQIRVHLASVGHPVINDELYGANGYKHGRLRNLKTKGHVLMSYYLKFVHPVTGKSMEYELDECRYDEDFKKVFYFLEQDKI